MNKELRFVYITMDGGHNSALRKAAAMLEREQGVRMHLSLHSSPQLRDDADWARLQKDVDQADFVFGCMIFGEEHVRPMQRVLAHSATPVCFITSNPALIKATHMGKFDLRESATDEEKSPGLFSRWMQKMRPKSGKSEGHRQTAMLKNLTKLMKYVPGKVRDVHSFVAMHNYWIHSSPENLKRMMCLLAERYVPGYKGKLPVQDPLEYADVAIYHPDAPAPFEDAASYRAWRRQRGLPLADGKPGAFKGAVGILTMRAIVLSGNTTPLDTLIRQIEAQGLEARAVYSALLDFRPSINKFLLPDSGLPPIDALVNTMGFPLVGGMAGSRPHEATETLHALDVDYVGGFPLAFQGVEDWRASDVGVLPIHVAMNIALPELDGSARSLITGGPTLTGEKHLALEAELKLAARRLARQTRLRHKANADKKLAIVLFNFPPNLGNVGTAAFLDVFNSIHRLLQALQAQGYNVDIPADADALRLLVAEGNAQQYGTDGNVAARLSLEDYRRLFPHHVDIEPYWGYAPGELLTDGRSFYILGAQLGNVFIGIQPSFGYERDPMRLLMGKGVSPHHGFAAFYTWLDQVYDADAVLHFGTHGALEFMPGKQTGISADCWPARLLGALPNYYYYCVNNPSEGTIAKRRGAATLVSYMVPPLQQAGLYKGLRLLKDSLENYQKRPSRELVQDIRAQAEKLGIRVEPPAASHEQLNGHANGHTNGHANGNGHASGNGHVNGNGHLNGHAPSAADDAAYIAALNHELIQVEHRMIPLGLHVLGKPPSEAELIDMLALVATFNPAGHPQRRDEKLPVLPALIARGLGHDYAALQKAIKHDVTAQVQWEQIDRIMREAIELFVVAPRTPLLDTRAVDAFLHARARLPIGLLANLWRMLDDLRDRIIHDQELHGLLHGLSSGYILPSPGNDVVRNQAIVPTGRNIHALDPYRVPSAAAMLAGTQLVDQMLTRLTAEQGALPETVAMVLWGTDNLKSDGEGVAQCLALLGARPIEDELGNIADVVLIPLTELGRPRVDVVMTISGIFRDLFHHQTNLLDKAVRLAANADEPAELNFVRKHTLAHAASLDVSLDEAALRVFSNAPGAYGANVNHMVESSTWEHDDELSDVFLARKSFAYGAGGQWKPARDLMERTLATVDATFQNIDSFELGISDVDHYYEYLGGVAKSVEKLSGKRPPVLVADAIATDDRLASLEQMVRLESRAKLLNPKWYESMLSHGYEGVREIELRVSNTYGWSATADAVEGWVYEDVAATFLLDEKMRARLAKANPHATAAMARRLLEADARGFWEADDALIEQLREIYGNLEDQLEGITA